MSNTKTISKNYTSLTTIASVCPTCSTNSTYSQETKVAVAEWHSDRKCITHQMQRNCQLLSLWQWWTPHILLTSPLEPLLETINNENSRGNPSWSSSLWKNTQWRELCNYERRKVMWRCGKDYMLKHPATDQLDFSQLINAELIKRCTWETNRPKEAGHAWCNTADVKEYFAAKQIDVILEHLNNQNMNQFEGA
jgi:hypothetical protein